MGLTLTTAPTIEPVTLDEARLWLRLDAHDEDDTVTNLVRAARNYVETVSGRSLITQTWTWTMDGFTDALYCPVSPVSAVSSIKYYDSNNALQTLSAATYEYDLHEDIAVIEPVSSSTWPSTYTRIDAVAVALVAGYGATPNTVPEEARTAIKMLVAHWFTRRDALVIGTISKEMEIGVARLLSHIRVRPLG
jgi:uncharacterized phiE125 gp8 family phage protein